MNQIRPNVFLGNSSDAREVGQGKTEGRWTIFNLAHDLSIPVVNNQRVTYVQVGLVDGPCEQDEQVLEAVNRLLDEVVRATTGQGKLLVHCHQGRSRSPTILALVLGKLESKSYDDLLAEFKTHRAIVAPEPALLALGRKFDSSIK